MPDLAEALYTTLEAQALFTGRVFRDRPGGISNLPYAVLRGDVLNERKIDLDGKARRTQRRIDIMDDDGTSSELVEQMAEAAAALFDEDPGLSITGFDVLGVSSEGPTDLPPDQETYGRSVLVTLWLEKE